MKVVFIQNIKGTAKIGDIKEVNDGYARNFLIPRKVAILATAESQKHAAKLQARYTISELQQKEKALELQDKLADFKLIFKEEANENGNLYGSVDREKISLALKQKHIELGDDAIILEQPLKTVGTHQISLKLNQDLTAQLSIEIENA